MMDENEQHTVIYTDGACKGNPGPGGWGVVIFYKKMGKVKELSGYEKITTNNRMELTAALEALKFFRKQTSLTLYTDSNYLKLGITTWIMSWKKKAWKNSKRESVKNIDLWKDLDYFNSYHNINWQWVKAHDGNPGNERADYLATKAIKLI